MSPGNGPPLFPFEIPVSGHKSGGRKARVSRSRNGIELSCIKISILDWFSDIRAWIYDIILRALKLEQLGMSLRTILARDFIENIAESQFWFSFRYSIPIGHDENEPRACNPPRQKYSTIAGQRYFILTMRHSRTLYIRWKSRCRDFTRIDRASDFKRLGRYQGETIENISFPSPSFSSSSSSSQFLRFNY